jgi:N-succinyldiaminopimelate aminotransferase
MTARRLAGIQPTIFSTMSQLALRTGAVNFGQGFPDASGPEILWTAADEAMRSGQNQYAPGTGVPALREAIARHQKRHYDLDVDPDTQVCVTTGCTEGIAAAILGLVDPGDEVVTLDPAYDSYDAMIKIAGGVRRGVPLTAPDYRLDGEALAAAVTGRTRMILLNTPHNPTGRVLDHDELAVVARVATEHDLVVVTDEVYEHLVFDGHRHVPLATLPGMWDRTLTLSSAGKSYSVTGWKVGWATGPAPLVQALLGAKQWLSFSSAAPLQPAVARALVEQPEFPARLAADLRDGRDLLVEGLRAIGLEPHVPEATYFTLTDVSHLGWTDGLEFCLALPERAGVVAIPAQGFYEDPAVGRQVVRWAFCKDRPIIDEGLRRLAKASLQK